MHECIRLPIAYIKIDFDSTSLESSPCPCIGEGPGQLFSTILLSQVSVLASSLWSFTHLKWKSNHTANLSMYPTNTFFLSLYQAQLVLYCSFLHSKNKRLLQYLHIRICFLSLCLCVCMSSLKISSSLKFCWKLWNGGFSWWRHQIEFCTHIKILVLFSFPVCTVELLRHVMGGWETVLIRGVGNKIISSLPHRLHGSRFFSHYRTLITSTVKSIHINLETLVIFYSSV